MTEASFISDDPKAARFALLIDAENFSHAFVNVVLSQLARLGEIPFRRAYGDFTFISDKWKDVAQENAIKTEHQFHTSTGKGCSDGLLMLDAMEILNFAHITGFAICSSNSDFTQLCIKLRERGKFVIGFGGHPTPAPLVKACSQFIHVNYDASNQTNVSEQADAAVKRSRQEPGQVRDTITPLSEIIEFVNETLQEDGSTMSLGELGKVIRRRFPDFQYKNYECPNMKVFVTKNLTKWKVTHNGADYLVPADE